MMVTFRPALADDRPFIVSGWSASYKRSRDVSFIPDEHYADVMHDVIGRVLERPGVEVIVASGEVLQGFVCFERPDYVVYIYVAQPFRGRDSAVARGLFTAAGIDPAGRFSFAARTKASWALRAKIPLAQYDPMRIRFTKDKAP